MNDCRRCGKCCLELGKSFWLHSDHELIEAFGKRMPPGFYNDYGPCDMLVIHESGRATCLLQKWLGHSAKPQSCRDYPFDGEKCFYHEGHEEKNRKGQSYYELRTKN